MPHLSVKGCAGCCRCAALHCPSCETRRAAHGGHHRPEPNRGASRDGLLLAHLLQMAEELPAPLDELGDGAGAQRFRDGPELVDADRQLGCALLLFGDCSGQLLVARCLQRGRHDNHSSRLINGGFTRSILSTWAKMETREDSRNRDMVADKGRSGEIRSLIDAFREATRGKSEARIEEESGGRIRAGSAYRW